MTGVGHGTPNAILMGLEGETPEGIETTTIESRVKNMYASSTLNIGGDHLIPFMPAKHVVFHYGTSLPQHPNGMRFSAFDKDGDLVRVSRERVFMRNQIATNEFFSIGGGFVVNEAMKLDNVYWKDARVDHVQSVDLSDLHPENVDLGPQASSVEVSGKKETQAQVTAALPFHNAESLKEICSSENLRISQVVFKNELQWRPAEEVTSRTLNLWKVMNQSIINGIHSTQDFLPGQLQVRRRAPKLYKRLMNNFAEYAGIGNVQHASGGSLDDSISVMHSSGTSLGRARVIKKRLPALDWISLYALAVNEENAAGGNS